MEELFSVIFLIFSVITACYGLYFAVISCFFLKKPRPYPESDKLRRFAVLIPARNEARCISGLIESLHNQNYPPELVEIYVIPNNCTDDTAGAALASGAGILSVSPLVRCKGQALQEAFYQLMETDSHDAYCVFDADNEADPNFLSEMNKALDHARAAKSRILAKNPHDSWICSAYETFFCNANLLLNRSRMNLGLSAHLIGTGFAVRRDLMEELGGWNTDTMTEDAEFYAILSALGEHIAFVPQAVTYDEEPLTFRQSLIQRRRWMSGIIQVFQTLGPELLHSVLSGTGPMAAADTLIQLSFVYVQAWILPVFFLRLFTDPVGTLLGLPMTILTFCLGAVALGLLCLLWERRLTWKKAAFLLLYPLFLFSFLPLQTLALFFPARTWKPIAHYGSQRQKKGSLV